MDFSYLNAKAVKQAIEPKATAYANKVADEMENYATQAAKNMKICPKCQTPSPADKTFCPNCGAKLPEETPAESTVCTQ